VKTEQWHHVREVLDHAIALPADQRSAYLEKACAGEEELRVEVESLLRSHERAGNDFLNRPAMAMRGLFANNDGGSSYIGHRVGAYEIVQEIGHGGMGKVYRAVRADGQYTKEVAVKLVRGGSDSGQVLERFLNERQILASLDHPNIARLLDGGIAADGAPYLVMELIEGERMDAYCDRHKLSIANRLELFQDVCGAVQFAHQRLVIHRDIKPSNVLVTEDGVPKLLDFGIAKILDPTAASGAETTLARPMTPEYASPEQVRGETITTATDVYSLGVVLYQILTGRSPYGDDPLSPHLLARAVCETEPARPSTAWLKPSTANGRWAGDREIAEAVSAAGDGSPAKLRRRLAGDLDNIVLMALRKEPQRRYASVEQLAEDIRRHVAGLPVTATPDSIGYRAGKFVRRHKMTMAAAALIVIAVGGGVMATAREARIAASNAQRAEKRFNDVRQLANSLIFEIHDSIQDLPGATPARKLLISRAIQYLDSLAQGSNGDLSLQRELAAAYARVGDLQVYRGDSAETMSSIASYQKALAIREALYASDNARVDDALALADSSRQMAEALMAAGQPATALPYSNRAVEISDKLARAEPADSRVLEELAHDYANQGNILAGDFNWSNLGENAAAVVVRRKQLETASRVASLEPDMPAARRRMGDAMIMLGDQLLLDGQRRAARTQYLQALQIMERLRGHVQSAQLLNDSDALYQRLANVALQAGDFGEAEVASRKALQNSEQLAQADPQNVWAQVMLAEDDARLADVLSRLGKRKEGLRFLEKALSTIDDVSHLNPDNTDVLGTLANIDLTTARILGATSQHDQPIRYCRDAIDVYSRVQKEQLSNVGIRLFLAAAYNCLGTIQARQRDLQSASDSYHKALDLTGPGTNSVEVLYMMASSYAGLGELETMKVKITPRSEHSHHWRQAQKWYALSATTWALVKEPGIASPNGFDCVPIKVVSEQLARANAVLRPAPEHFMQMQDTAK
jgi:eukaryotic-like serine/threonine-protein kinase